MERIKERRKIVHEPSTQEIFHCLCVMPAYSKILSEQSTGKSFDGFLRWLIEKKFYQDRRVKITIKQVATDYKSDSTKVTKWIKEIYAAIFELNLDKPELFQGDGVKLSLYIRHYDDSCSFDTTLPVLPREFETIRFPFVKGKVGADQFWVKKVEHEIVVDSTTVTVWLEGRILNKYREFALDRALFQGWIHFMDVFHKHDYELDDELKEINKILYTGKR